MISEPDSSQHRPTTAQNSTNLPPQNDGTPRTPNHTANLKSFFSATSTTFSSFSQSIQNKLNENPTAAAVQNPNGQYYPQTGHQTQQNNNVQSKPHDATSPQQATVQNLQNTPKTQNAAKSSYLNNFSQNFASANLSTLASNITSDIAQFSQNYQNPQNLPNQHNSSNYPDSCPSDTELPDSDDDGSEENNTKNTKIPPLVSDSILELNIFNETVIFTQVQAFITTQKLLQQFRILEQSNSDLLKSLKTFDITPTTVEHYLIQCHQKIARLTKEREASVLKYVFLDAQILKHRESAESNKKLAEQKLSECSRQKIIADKSVSEAQILNLDLKQTKKEITDAQIKIGQAAKQISSLQKSIVDQKNEADTTKRRLLDTETLYIKSARELKQAKEETAQIRLNCNTMVKTFQDSEESESNKLKSELKDLQSKFDEKISDFSKIPKIEAEITIMKEKCQKATDQAVSKTSQCSVLTNEIKLLEQKAKFYENILNKQKEKGNEQLTLFKRKSAEIVQLNLELKNKDKFEDRVKELEGLLSQRESEFDEIDLKLKEKSKFCRDLTEQLAEGRSEASRLKVENEGIVGKIGELEAEMKNNTKVESGLGLNSEVSETVRSSFDNAVTSAPENQEAFEKLKTENSELKKNLTRSENNLKSSGKSYDQKIKNLKREFTKVTRELNGFKKGVTQTIVEVRDRSNSVATTGTEGENHDVMSISSKTSSSHRDSSTNPQTPINSPLLDDLNSSTSSSLYQQYDAIDKPLLIDKILRIQKLHHKKNDKIEQLLTQNEEHAKELKKQGLVIKHLLLKIPADITPSGNGNINQNNVKQKRKLATDNPGLLLEMNAKLQILLEDTIGQNGALKENLKTLGNEIAGSKGK